MSWNIYLGWSSLTLKPTIEYNFFNGPKRWTEPAEAEGTQQCKKQAFSEGKSFRTLKTEQWTADCWPWSAPYCRCGDEWKWISKSIAVAWHAIQNHVKRYSELPKTITFAHDRLLWPLVLFLAQIFASKTAWRNLAKCNTLCRRMCNSQTAFSGPPNVPLQLARVTTDDHIVFLPDDNCKCTVLFLGGMMLTSSPAVIWNFGWGFHNLLKGLEFQFGPGKRSPAKSAKLIHLCFKVIDISPQICDLSLALRLAWVFLGWRATDLKLP